jgi:hypothetical protein
MNPGAHGVLDEIERIGGSCSLRDGKLVVSPAAILTADLRKRIHAVRCDVAALLREREESSPPTVACELRRFPDWHPDMVVRFCAEPGHWHEDRVPTFDCVEIDLLLAWAVAAVRRLDAATRNALLDLKARFGGRIDASTIDAMVMRPVTLGGTRSGRAGG